MIENSTLTIDLNTLRLNIEKIQASLQQHQRIIGVVKANAYGLGLVEVAKVLDKSDVVCAIGIAQLEEGIILRANQITKPLMLLSAVREDQIEKSINASVDLLLNSLETLSFLEEYHQTHKDTIITVNLAINTGFNRYGFKPGDELNELTNKIKNLSWLKIRSVYSHPIEGEVEHSPLVYKQLEIFKQALIQLDEATIDYGYKHFCNSGASEWLEEGLYDAVRLGRRLFMDSPNTHLKTGIIEPMTWLASILEIRSLQAHESTGYNQAYIAKRETRIAVINVGYGDGLYFYKQSQHIPVMLNGQRAPVLAVCMDCAIIDITNIECTINDPILLFGNHEGHTLNSQEVAAVVKDEGCTITTLISARVKRRYID